VSQLALVFPLTVLIIIRCSSHHVPVGFISNMFTAKSVAKKLADKISNDPSVAHEYAEKINADASDPICVASYEFIDGQLSGINATYHITPKVTPFEAPVHSE
jgi:hypothetical protein